MQITVNPVYLISGKKINASTSRLFQKNMTSLADIAVLFVDDEVEILSALKSCFRREPYVKLFAESAEQALALLEESNGKAPVVVIASDIHMPDINGIELIRRVKSRFPDTICMLVSGAHNMHELVKEVCPGHIFTTLTKPIDVPVLKKAIIDAIDCYQNNKTCTR